VLEVFLNEKLNIGASRSSFKIIEAILDRVDSTMDKDSPDCRYFSQHMAFNIIGTALFGEVFFDWPDAAAYEELLMIVAKDGCFWASYAVPPFWKPGYRKYRSLCAKLKILTEGIIRKSIEQSSLRGHNDLRSCKKSEGVVKDPVGCTSLLDGIISGRCLYGAVERSLSSEEEICGNIVGLMLHGISASANLIGSILTRLVLYPKLKDQVHIVLFLSVTDCPGCSLYDVKIDNYCFLLVHMMI
jgi:cytochrome P450